MIQADIRVNGALIGVLTCVNKGPFGTEGLTAYKTVLMQTDGEDPIIKTVLHKPKDGFEVLMEKAFCAVGHNE